MRVQCLKNRVQFVSLAMEGPDPYSMVGGLGIRVTELCRCLAEAGYETHQYFVGDPNLPDVEVRGHLTLHRWCQWLSRGFPFGVYEGEVEKVRELELSWPEYVVEFIVKPGAKLGLTTVFLTEDWQTVKASIRLGQVLECAGLSRNALILWNANNCYGFSDIDWRLLERYVAVTAVSRYMKHAMWRYGLNPIVVRNGIPVRYLQTVPSADITELRRLYPQMMLVKVGRYDVDKRWIMALETVAELKRRGHHPRLLIRGGKESHRVEVLERAHRLGLSWNEIAKPADNSVRGILRAMVPHMDSDIQELCFYVPDEFIRLMYAGADCVLANSGHEPFGLVGLEVQASAGVVIVGATGEDYASNLVNCLSVETDDCRELATYIETLQHQPELVAEIRRNGLFNAEAFTWDKVADDLFLKINYLAQCRGIENA